MAGKESAVNNLTAEILYYDFLAEFEEKDLPEYNTDYHYKFIYVLEGFCELQLAENNFSLEREDLLLYSGDNAVVSKCSNSLPISLYYVGFKTNWSLFLDDEAQNNNALHICNDNKYSKKIKQILDMLSYEINIDGFSEACNGVLAVLIVFFIRLQRTRFDNSLERDNDDLAQKIRQYLDLHYAENLSLKQIADKFHISRDYLSHLFKNSINISPINYVINRRIGEAQMLLLNTNWSINEIANRVGYDNASYFNTLFKKVVGISPGEFRLYSKKNI
jgi:AraC-like DNA-binding protein